MTTAPARDRMPLEVEEKLDRNKQGPGLVANLDLLKVEL
jgi:hypothetical protein